MIKATIAALAATFALIASANASDASHAMAVKLLSMPGPDGSLQLVDVGVMPATFDKGMMVILCDAQCQGVLHLVGKPTSDSRQIAMGVTVYVDAHSAAARLLGGR